MKDDWRIYDLHSLLQTLITYAPRLENGDILPAAQQEIDEVLSLIDRVDRGV